MAVPPQYLEWVGGNTLEQGHKGKLYCHNNCWMMTPFNCEAIHLKLRILLSFFPYFSLYLIFSWNYFSLDIVEITLPAVWPREEIPGGSL